MLRRRVWDSSGGGRRQRCAGAMAAAPLLNRTFLVTGATDGIGLHTAQKLASQGATVLVHGRWGSVLVAR